MLRFPFYRIKRGDNLGDPETWNTRFEDVDLRLAAREQDATKIDNAVDQLTQVALDRLNETFTPLINELQQQLQDVGAAFVATSADERTIATGAQTFLLTPETRAQFVTTDYTVIRPIDDLAIGMVAQVIDYDRASGLLTVDTTLAIGKGTFAGWRISVSPPANLAHETRLDNPHEVTAAQAGAYTTAQVDAALAPKAPLASPMLTGSPTAPTPAPGTNTTQIATAAFVQAALGALIASAPGALDTLNELAAALGDDANFSATVAAALAARVRTDADQGLDETEQAQARKNISAVPVIASAAPLVINVNPGMLLSQEHGDNAVGTSLEYVADQWQLAKDGIVGTCTGQRVADVAASPGLRYRVQIAVPIEATGAGEYAMLYQVVEGNRARPLGWKSGGGVATLYGLLFSTVAIRKSVFVRPTDVSVSYVHEVDLIAGYTFFSVPVPPPAASASWLEDSGAWGTIGLVARSGADMRAAAADAWVAGNKLVGPNHQNNDGVQEYIGIVTMGLLPGAVPVTQAMLPYLVRAIDQEQLIGNRYYRSQMEFYQSGDSFAGLGVGYSSPISPPMRVAPTVVLASTGQIGMTGSPAASGVTAHSLRVTWIKDGSAGGYVWGANATLNARF